MKLLWVCYLLGDPVLAQVISFPDANLKQALVNGLWSTQYGGGGVIPVDVNGDGEIDLSEAESVTGFLDLSEKGITDITALETFSNLRFLHLRSNPLTTLTIDDWPNLEILDASNCEIQLLHMENLPDLYALTLDRNPIDFDSFVLAQTPALDTLLLNATGMTAMVIDLDVFPALMYLRLGNNHLSELYLPSHETLKEIFIGGNPLSGSLTLGALPALETLLASNCQLTSLDINHLTAIRRVSASGNQIKRFSGAGLPNLDRLDLGFNPLTDLELSVENALLAELHLESTRLASLQLDGYAYLKNLRISGGDTLETIEVTNLPALERFNVGASKLTEVHLFGFPALEYVGINKSPLLQELVLESIPELAQVTLRGCVLSSYQFTDLPKLAQLQLVECGLSTIELSNLPSLFHIDVTGNVLQSFDFDNLPSLDTLIINENRLTSLDTSNYPNLFKVEARDNVLTSVNVPQVVSLNVSNNQLRDIELPPAIQIAYVSGNDLTTIGLNLPQLRGLALDSNPLVTLDLTSAPQIEYLSIGDMPISAVSLGSLPNLRHLEIQGPRPLDAIAFGSASPIEIIRYRQLDLNQLEVPNLPNLTDVGISNSRLVNIAVEGSPNLRYFSVSFSNIRDIGWLLASPWMGTPGEKIVVLNYNLLSQDDCAELLFLETMVDYLDYQDQGGINASPDWDHWPSVDILLMVAGEYTDFYELVCE